MRARLRIAIAVLLLAVPAVAQQPAAPPEPPAPPGPPAAGNIEPDGLESDSLAPAPGAPERALLARLRELRGRRMADYLQLNEEQAEALEQQFHDFRERQRVLRTERKRLLEDLRRSVEADSSRSRELERERHHLGPGGRGGDRRRPPHVDRQRLEGLERHLKNQDAALNRELEALRRNQEARERALHELRRQLSEELTLEQQARLQLFAERFQRQLREGARRLRERHERLRRESRRSPEATPQPPETLPQPRETPPLPPSGGSRQP